MKGTGKTVKQYLKRRQKKHGKHEWRTNMEISFVCSQYTKQSVIPVLMGEGNKTEDRV